MIYYKLYKSETINLNTNCKCGNCSQYHELFHAERITYEQIKSKNRALRLKKTLYPNASIIEVHTALNTMQEIKYINLTTGSGMQYNADKDKWVKCN